MSEQEKIVEEVITDEETPEEGAVEITVSISNSGNFKVDATPNVHPVFLTGLLQYAINAFASSGRNE